MRLRFKPTKARILVEPIHGVNQIGSLMLPSNAREGKPAEAMVVALGPANKLEVKVGDRVVTQRYNGSEVRIGGKQYRLLEAEDVIARVEE